MKLKILVVGHSLINPRQHWLLSTIAGLDLANVLALAPKHWQNNDRCPTIKTDNFELRPIDFFGNNLINFNVRGLKTVIEEFNPDILYIMQEPYSTLTYKTTKLTTKYDIPTYVFTWENRQDFFISDINKKYEEEVIKSDTQFICGNKEAQDRIISIGANPDSTYICPQTGINTELFSPTDEPKIFDIVYHGRFATEKGISHINNATTNRNVLWVGWGNDTDLITHGTQINFIKYLLLPNILIQAKIGVQYPYAYKGYSEQFNYSIAECMSCGLPVVTSTNGSINDIYRDAPVTFAIEDNEMNLHQHIENLLQDTSTIELLGRKSRKWVQNNLSLPVIAKRLINIIK